MMKVPFVTTATIVVGLLFFSLVLPNRVPSASAAFRDISIKDNFFDPATITINTGDIAFWTNNGASAHNITSSDGLWGFPSLPPGFPYSHTFNTPGVFTYYDSFYPGMTGTIIVQDSNGLPPATSAAYLPLVLITQPSPTAPPPSTLLTSVSFGTTFASGDTCQLTDPLAEPVNYPAGTNKIAYQIDLNYPQVNSIEVSIVGDTGGGGVTGTTCSSYAIVNGRPYLARTGGTLTRLDSQAFNAGSYLLRIKINHSQTVDVPFGVR